jgi:hypothetical protein
MWTHSVMLFFFRLCHSVLLWAQMVRPTEWRLYVVKMKKTASVAPSFMLEYDQAISVKCAPIIILDVDSPQSKAFLCECVWKENCSVGENVLGIENCEPLLRNYFSLNRLGTGNLREGSNNFDLLANCIIWKDNLMASIDTYLILTNLHSEKQIISWNLKIWVNWSKKTCVELTGHGAFRPNYHFGILLYEHTVYLLQINCILKKNHSNTTLILF